MKNSTKIFSINLALLLIYSLLIRISQGSTRGEASLGILLMSCVVITLHVILNFLIGIVFFMMGKREYGNNFLLSAGIVLLVGFGVCWGNASI